jgi:hypothetical protein
MIRAGTVVGGFEVERVLERTPWGTVYEAVQLSLDRRVALAVLDGRAGTAACPHRQAALEASWRHPNAVAVYGLGESVDGMFVATQLVRGPTLAELLRGNGLDERRAIALLGQLAEALDAAHAAGLVHGEVGPRNVIVDEGNRAFLSGFGRPRPEPATPEGDLGAFAAMLRECLGQERDVLLERPASAAALVRAAATATAARRPAGLRPYALRTAATFAMTGMSFAFSGVGGLGAAPPEQPVPAVLAGARPLGSHLAIGPRRIVGCNARSKSSGCTILQLRGAVAPTSGAIRRWAVRGARGGLRLQVIRRLPDGRLVCAVQSSWVVAPDTGAHAFKTSLPIRRGDLLGVQLLPEGEIGIGDADGAVAYRQLDPLSYRQLDPLSNVPRRLGRGERIGDELLLRADVVAGARARTPVALTGARAAAAPAGRELGTQPVELRPGLVVRVALVALPGRIALDAFRGARRIARSDVPGADPRGVLSRMEQEIRVPLGAVYLSWWNPGSEVPLDHRYTVRPRSIAFLD